MLPLVLSAALAAAPPPAARTAVQNAVARMGGADALRRLDTLLLEWVGYTNLLEQSERPDGPWIPAIQKTTEVWDAPRRRWSETSQATVAESEYTLRTVVDGEVAARRFGDRWIPAGPGDVDGAVEWMSLSPQAVLLAALAAPELHDGPASTRPADRDLPPRSQRAADPPRAREPAPVPPGRPGPPTAGGGPEARERANRDRPRQQSHRAPAGPRGDRGAHDARVSSGRTNPLRERFVPVGPGGAPRVRVGDRRVARREKLDVATVFAMHSDPTPWEKLLGLATPAPAAPGSF